MNYAALLGVIAAAAFTLPLLAHGAQRLGLPRAAGVAVSLATALLAAGFWYWRARRAVRLADHRLRSEERDASV